MHPGHFHERITGIEYPMGGRRSAGGRSKCITHFDTQRETGHILHVANLRCLRARLRCRPMILPEGRTMDLPISLKR